MEPVQLGVLAAPGHELLVAADLDHAGAVEDHVAAGVDALFMEVHDNPAAAKSDAANVWPLDKLAPLLETLLRIREAAGRID